jgi:hypothetical protein
MTAVTQYQALLGNLTAESDFLEFQQYHSEILVRFGPHCARVSSPSEMGMNLDVGIYHCLHC